MSQPSARRDLHANIRDQLIETIEKDPGAPQLPWRRAAGPLQLPRNAITHNTYSGINVLALWTNALKAGFEQPLWATFKQWQELGAQVRKGEKGSLVVLYREYRAKTDDGDDGSRADYRRVSRASFVFNVAQVEGYSPPTPLAPTTAWDGGAPSPLAMVEAFVTCSGALVLYGGDQAYYSRRFDQIHMPERHRFIGTATSTPTEAFYATLLHELAHWTGAEHRLDRRFGQRFGDQAYAAEELVAELASAFMCAELEITLVPRLDHAQYLASWLALLKSDKGAIFNAAARASEAVEFLRGRWIAGRGEYAKRIVAATAG